MDETILVELLELVDDPAVKAILVREIIEPRDLFDDECLVKSKN